MRQEQGPDATGTSDQRPVVFPGLLRLPGRFGCRPAARFVFFLWHNCGTVIFLQIHMEGIMSILQWVRAGVVSTAILLGVTSLPGTSTAATIAASGTTDVTVSDVVLSFLSSNFITASPLAPATASGATFSFPITGGVTNPLVITHSGGLRLEGGAAFLEATNFVIDAAAGTVFGSATGSALGGDPVSADLFSLSNVLVSGNTITADLLITSTLNSVLGLTFAGPDTDLGLTGLTFGTASTSPAAVPLPAAAWLLLAGFGALGAIRARRRVSAA